jgi:curli biogenesis system outer membrane secretion channel CsgG
MPKQERGSRSFLFDDQLAGTKGLNIGEKVADALIAKIAGNGTFEVVDRQYLDRIVAEQNLKMDTRFDPANAAKLGKLANVDVLITGQVDAFSADAPSETSNGFFSNKTKVTGEIELRVTARMISVETASILAAPTATSDLNQVLSEKTDVLPSSQGSISSKTTGTGNIKAALLKLVDKSVEAVSLDLAGQIEANVSKVPGGTVRSAGPVAKVVGMDGSLVLINRGANTGIKSGQQFVVVRLIDTGLKDPDTGQAITKKKKICTITITDVDETTASGNMEGEQPKAGDELKTIQGN